MRTHPETAGWTPDWPNIIAGSLLATIVTSGVASVLEANGHPTSGWHTTIDTRYTNVVDDATTHSRSTYDIQTPVGIDRKTLSVVSPFAGSIKLNLPNVVDASTKVTPIEAESPKLDALARSTADFLSQHKGAKENVSITITGLASDEWTGNPNNAGLGQADAGNKQVAKSYATAVSEAFVTSLRQDGYTLAASNVHIQAQEVILTPDQQQSISDIKAALGYQSVGDLLRAYNSQPDKIGTSDQRAILDRLLAQNRGADVSARADANGTEALQATIYRVDEGCWVVTNYNSHVHKGGAKFPVVICFVPFPWVRRRNRHDESRRQSRLRRQQLRAARMGHVVTTTDSFYDAADLREDGIRYKKSQAAKSSKYTAKHYGIHQPGLGGGIGSGEELTNTPLDAATTEPVVPVAAVETPRSPLIPETAPVTQPELTAEPTTPIASTTKSEAAAERTRRKRRLWIIPIAVAAIGGSGLVVRGCDADTRPKPQQTTVATPPTRPTAPIASCRKTTNYYQNDQLISSFTIPGVAKIGTKTVEGSFQGVK